MLTLLSDGTSNHFSMWKQIYLKKLLLPNISHMAKQPENIQILTHPLLKLNREKLFQAVFIFP